MFDIVSSCCMQQCRMCDFMSWFLFSKHVFSLISLVLFRIIKKMLPYCQSHVIKLLPRSPDEVIFGSETLHDKVEERLRSVNGKTLRLEDK